MKKKQAVAIVVRSEGAGRTMIWSLYPTAETKGGLVYETADLEIRLVLPFQDPNPMRVDHCVIARRDDWPAEDLDRFRLWIAGMLTGPIATRNPPIWI